MKTFSFNSEFGFVFTYTGNDRNGYKHAPYRVLAHTPEELYEAMANWHRYGNSEDDAIVPNTNFKAWVSAIFSVEDGSWSDYRGTRCAGGYQFSNYYNSFKTTGCGCWSITVDMAEAHTIEKHDAILTAAADADKAERIRIANERTEQMKVEYNTVRRGWYFVQIEVRCHTIDDRRKQMTFSGYTLADSMMDAYTKAATKECQDMCSDRGLIFEGCSAWNSNDTEVSFVGMKTDDGFSISAWEEFVNA